MRRSRTTILKQYEPFVKTFENVCRALGWNVRFKQDVDEMLHVFIDGYNYIVGHQANSAPEFPIYCISVLVITHSSHRDEPDSEDEKILSEGHRDPRRIILSLIDIHWREKRHIALEQDWLPEDEQHEY